MAKIVLIVSGLMLLAFGVACLIKPISVLSNMGLNLPNDPMIRTELRAFYGGLEIALGIVLVYCAFNPTLVKPALWLCFLIFACVGGARLMGILIDHSATRTMIIVTAFEWAIAIAALIPLLSNKKA